MKSEFSLDQALEVLRNTPRTIRNLLTGLSDDWIFATEGGDSWSAFDIVGHLISGDRTDWVVRARIICEHGSSRSFDPYDRFSQFEESKGKSLADLLDEFDRTRPEAIRDLEALINSDEDLDRTGVHPDFGEVTMRQLLASWVVHDLGHIAQISRVLAKRYTADTGPWIQYLPVLTDRS